MTDNYEKDESIIPCEDCIHKGSSKCRTCKHRLKYTRTEYWTGTNSPQSLSILEPETYIEEGDEWASVGLEVRK